MASLAVSDHIAGGYFVARSAPGSPPWMPPEFGVGRSISASSELVPLFPLPTWARDFEGVAARFGLRVDQRGPAGQLADKFFDVGILGWPDVFFELSDAQAFYDRFAAGRDDVVVLGVGLVANQVDAFLTETVECGVSHRLGRHEPLVAAGTPLGYELLGMDVPPFYSWAVNYLPATVHERLGIAVNQDGLIPSLDDATRAAEFASRADVPSEPVIWRPWLLVQYAPCSALHAPGE